MKKNKNDWACTYDTCNHCEIEKFIWVKECPVLQSSARIVDIMEWEDVPQARGNMQLELMQKWLPMRIVLDKFITKLEECHKHIAEYQWTNHSHILDLVMSNPERR